MPDPTPCPTCGNPLQADAKFCGTCGTATAPVPVVHADEPSSPTTAFGSGDPSAPSPTAVGGVGPIGAPVDEPSGFAVPGAPPTPPGGVPPVVPATAFPPTVANPTASPLPPTLAEQAVAGAAPGGPPMGGPPTGGPGDGTDGEHPHWMPDPSKESKSSRTGLFIVLGVAGGVLLTLVALVLWLTLGNDEEVSSGDTTSTTQEQTTTTEQQTTTSTTEGETTTTSQATSTTATTAAPGGATSLAGLAVGDCVTQDVSASGLTGFDVVDCGSSHRAELYATFNLPDGPFPDGADGNQVITERCLGDAFESYVGTDYQSSEIYVTGVFPDEGTWDDGTRTVHCFGHEQDPDQTFTGTIRNSNR